MLLHIHIQAMIATLGILVTTLLWVKGVYGAPWLFMMASSGTVYVAYRWVRDFTATMDKTKRSI